MADLQIVSLLGSGAEERIDWPAYPDTSLIVWVLFERPDDWPQGWVLRRQIITRGNEIVVEPVGYGFASLEATRAALPPGLILFQRAPEDSPSLVESWM